MLKDKFQNKPLAIVVVSLMFLLSSLPSNAFAMPFPSKLAPSGENSIRETDLTVIQTQIEKKIVKERLADLGLTQEDITTQLSKLSDGQIHLISQKAQNIKTGGDALSTLAFILVVLLIIFAVFEVTGQTDFVKP